MAGVPAIFQAMVQSVLPALTGGAPLLSRTLRIDRPEGEIAGPLASVAGDYPGLAMGSYPFQLDGKFGSNVVIRGVDPDQIGAALSDLQAALGGEPV